MRLLKIIFLSTFLVVGWVLPSQAINNVYVVHLILDGLRYDLLNEMVAQGELPHLKDYFVDHGATFEKALTLFPSVSTPAYVSFTTGLGSGNSGVCCLEWFDRTKQIPVGYLSLQGIKRVNKDLFNQLALYDEKQFNLYPPTTLFEKLFPEPTAAIYTPFYHGATIRIPKGIPLTFLWSAVITRNGNTMNKIAMKQLTKLFSKNRGQIPRYTSVALYGTDFDGHKRGPTSEKVREDMKTFDILFQKFLTTLESEGLKDKTYIILSSDHGMHTTGKLFKLRKTLRQKGFRDKSILYVSNRGVSSTFLSVRGEGGWQQLPSLERLKNISVKGKVLDLIQTLLDEDEVDWIALRDGLDRVHVFDLSGEGIITQSSIAKQKFYSYSYQHKDPLGYANNPKLLSFVQGTPYSSDQWLQATAEAPRPNAVVELSNLFEDPRVGDILVVAKDPWGFRKAKAGTHGSLTQEDMHIPLWIHGPSIPHGHFKIARGVDLYPTILGWFGLVAENFENQEGKPLFQRPREENDATSSWLAKLEQNLQQIPPQSMRQRLTFQCKEELRKRRQQIEKIKDLQIKMTDPKNPLGVPKKLKSNMIWELAWQENLATQRLKRMEEIEHHLEKL